ncbi:formyltetrahydrofolate deformylase [Niveispirillum sp.]|uniref:formyltetrahydrofolate deformylase n=1 Tax=Niveispirillum sp. TaxID=1917217 RepID=UPI001B448934|nr:formyltetrahydrofolate deformylase [Niveispirillum sp.]MBP7336001.1 formyltetrahydrofolate deformylase [Niveispirillum sp.]
MSTLSTSALILKCPDQRGIVANVSGFLADHGASIVESNQFNDPDTDTFYMRVEFRLEDGTTDLAGIERAFAAVGNRFDMNWTLFDMTVRPRVLIAVSRFGHCLFDLLHRWRSGLLPVEVVGVVSNHADMRSFVEWSGLPYHHLPVTGSSKAQQEGQFLELVRQSRADLVVLARYMQILSPDLCAALAGRCINIHHSFLPSFKGAKPYHQAHMRGVKLIGATAHYVTTDLDEGPIIEQGVERVNHSQTAERLVEIGRDIECTVLARAVRWHAEHRIILNGQKTVVFA